jgi:hypothetical protein
MAMTGVMLADFSAFRKEADSSTASLKQLESGGDAAAAKLQKIGEGLGANIKQALTDPVGAAADATKGLSSALVTVATPASLAAAGLLGLGTAALGLATSAAKVVAEFDDLHDKTDISVPTLSRLSNAAQVVGADMGTLTNVVFKLEEGMGNNTDAFQKGLAQMGLSTDALKSAGPDRYLELITAGLQSIPDASTRAAAGTAVMGKQYRDVAATLNDLATGLKLTADITPFTAQEAADAEAFQFQIASMKTHMSALTTELGTALIPAVSGTLTVLGRMGEAMVHVADLGGLVSTAWKGIKLSLGEADLAAQTANATAATTNQLFAEQGATASSVAEKMLEMGYSEKTVAEQTGLTAEQVRSLNTALTATKGAAEAYAATWDRVNGLLAQGKPTLDGVSESTKGLALDMQEAGVAMKDITATTGLTAGQMALLKKNTDEATKSFTEWKTATANVDAAMVPWTETLNSMSGAVVEAIKYALSMGVSQSDLQKSFGVTALQIKAVQIALEEESAAMATEADLAIEMAKRRVEITQQLTKATNDAVVAKLKQQQAEENFLAEQLKDAQAQDAIQQGIKTTADTAAAAGPVIQSAFERSFAQSAASFDQFKGVVVAGTQQMGDAIASFNASTDPGAYVELQRKIRDAQNARGGFYVDTGFAPPPIQTRDVGGPVVAGQSYLIGGGNAPELFTPGATGFVTPTKATAFGGAGGGGGGVVNHFYITQPLGTPDAIARAVNDAQVAAAKGQGVRLPYA